MPVLGRHHHTGAHGGPRPILRWHHHAGRKCRAFIDAMTLVVRDGCDPHKVHAAMMGLDEYVDALPDDMLPRDLLAKRMEG